MFETGFCWRQFSLPSVHNAPERFSRRTQLYAGFDVSLAPHTRFFGAAAMTTAVLADLFTPIVGRVNTSTHTRIFLEQVSLHLEAVNVASADRIARGAAQQIDLDRELVRQEQCEVQLQLDRLRSTRRAAYDGVVYELDRLINPGSLHASLANFFINARHYRRILHCLGAELGRALSFAYQSDRESIGCGLIAELRRTSPAM